MKTWIKILAFTLVYTVAGKLGLRLAYLNASASAVWPPTGIAIAVLLIFGQELWPGALLGAFLINISTAGTVLTSLGIAAGNTIEVVTAAYLVNRFAHGRHAFEDAADISKYTFVAGCFSTAISATIGTTSLAIAGFAPLNQFGEIWTTWWLGDMAGALIVAPFFLLWSVPSKPRWRVAQWPELALLIGVLVIAGWVVFGGLFHETLMHYPYDYLYVPIIVWAAYRFGERETSTASLILLAMAIWGTLHGFGPFVRKSPNTSLMLMQSFMIVITMTGLTLASMVSRHRESERQARQRAFDALEASEKRYRQLLESNIIGTMVVDWEGRVFDANDAFLHMVGYSRQDLEEGRVGGEELTPPEYRSLDEWARAKLKESGVCPPLEKEYIRKDGTRVPVLVGVVFHEEPDHHLVCLVIDASDRRKAMAALRLAYDEMETRVIQRTSELAKANLELTQEVERRKRAEAALHSMAITDSLTGLYNRRGFSTLANQLLEQARRSGHPFLLFLADLDGLKLINDTHGHLEGDQALHIAATHLKDTFRASDVVARIGGDEFAVAVLQDVEETGEHAIRARLEQKLQEFNARGRKHYVISLSVGVAELKPTEEQSIDALLAKADIQLYEQKRVRKIKVIEP